MPTSNQTIIEHPAFKECSQESLNELIAQSQNHNFQIGRVLSQYGLIQSNIYIIASGQARLVGKENNKIISLARLGIGNIVGLSSLLRGEGCEEIHAAEDLIAVSLPDKLIAKIYNTEPSFRNWCNQTVFPGEISELVKHISESNELKSLPLQTFFGAAFRSSSILSYDSFKNNKIPKNSTVFVGCKSTSLELNKNIKAGDAIVTENSTFDTRLICIANSAIHQTVKSYRADENIATEIVESDKSDGSSNPRTSLSLNNRNIVESIKVFKGIGVVEECIACYRIISEILKVPFRRDAVEKPIKASLTKGTEVDLQMLGQLGDFIGLHVVAATLDSNYCTRLNTPAIINWEKSFGVIIKSNAETVAIAHPVLGLVEVSPSTFIEKSGVDFQVIFLDRLASSQNKTFDFTWFLPAIKKYRRPLLQVLLASFVVQLFTLANPLLIQVIIDKVISQRSLDTLQVLGFALVGVTIFEGV